MSHVPATLTCRAQALTLLLCLSFLAPSPLPSPLLPPRCLQAMGRDVPRSIKYSGRPSMASTATGFGEVHAQEQVRAASVQQCSAVQCCQMDA